MLYSRAPIEGSILQSFVESGFFVLDPSSLLSMDGVIQYETTIFLTILPLHGSGER